MKAGTTSLHYYLGQHPDVFMSPVKEPRFFSREGAPPSTSDPRWDKWNASAITDLDEYLALFAGATGERVLGESSTEYLYSPKATEGIRRHLPDVRLLAIFRDPVDRALSAYGMFQREGKEDASAFDDIRGYKRRGLYADHLERYLEAFGRERMALYLYDDLVADPVALCKHTFTFLDVDPGFRPDVSEARNAATRLRSPALRATASASRGFVKRLPEPIQHRISQLSARAPHERVRYTMSPDTRRKLCDFFADDVKRLGVLLDRDLSHWLQAD